MPIVIFTGILNLFCLWYLLSSSGRLRLPGRGCGFAVIMAVRILALIAGASLLTYTTSPIELTDAIESLLKPLKVVHFPVHELAMMMTIALRFIPTLIEETDKNRVCAEGKGSGF